MRIETQRAAEVDYVAPAERRARLRGEARIDHPAAERFADHGMSRRQVWLVAPEGKLIAAAERDSIQAIFRSRALFEHRIPIIQTAALLEQFRPLEIAEHLKSVREPL